MRWAYVNQDFANRVVLSNPLIQRNAGGLNELVRGCQISKGDGTEEYHFKQYFLIGGSKLFSVCGNCFSANNFYPAFQIYIYMT